MGKIVKKQQKKPHTVLRLSIKKDHTKTKNKKTNANYMKQSYTPNETLLWLLILIADTATGVVSFYSWRQNCCCVYPLLCWFLMKIIIVINLCACVSGGLLRITLKERVAMHEDDDSIELESSLFWSDRCNISWVRLRRLRDRGCMHMYECHLTLNY